MKKVFVCSRYRAATPEELKVATLMCEEIAKVGAMPLAPHLYFTRFLDDDDPEQRGVGMGFARVWLAECDLVWYDGSTEWSEGMTEELQLAMKMRKQIVPVDTKALQALAEAEEQAALETELEAARKKKKRKKKK